MELLERKSVANINDGRKEKAKMSKEEIGLSPPKKEFWINEGLDDKFCYAENKFFYREARKFMKILAVA